MAEIEFTKNTFGGNDKPTLEIFDDDSGFREFTHNLSWVRYEDRGGAFRRALDTLDEKKQVCVVDLVARFFHLFTEFVENAWEYPNVILEAVSQAHNYLLGELGHFNFVIQRNYIAIKMSDPYVQLEHPEHTPAMLAVRDLYLDVVTVASNITPSNFERCFKALSCLMRLGSELSGVMYGREHLQVSGQSVKVRKSIVKKRIMKVIKNEERDPLFGKIF